MSLVLILSILIRVAALTWAIALVRLLRDWRMGMLCLMVGLMALRQILTLLASDPTLSISVTGNPEEVPGLLVSVFVLLAVFFLGRIISEQREATNRSRRSQRIMKLVMDTIPQRLFWKDRSYRYIGCNKVFAQDAGLESPEQIIGRHDFELSWKASAHLYREDDIAVVERGVSKINYEEPQIRSDGTRLWLRTTKLPLRDESGEVIGVFGSYEDITERKATEEKVRESEARYRTLVEQASDGIFVADVEGNYLDVNTAGCELLGYTHEEMLSMNIRDVIPAEEQGDDPPQLEALPSGMTIIRERHLKRKDETLVPVEIGAKRLPDGRLQGIVRDISKRKQEEEQRQQLTEQLRQAQKMEVVGQLAGGVAHDFNNLLTSILGHGEIILKDPTLSQEVRRDVEEMQAAAKRGAALTQQLLTFSRRQVLVPRTLNLNEVVTGLEVMLRRLIGEDIALSIATDPDLGRIRADPVQLEQVILNLAINARDAMPAGGELVIATENVDADRAFAGSLLGVAPGAYVRMSVRDTGCGMDAETRRHAFEPFFTTKEAGRGTGLGLSMVYGIIQQSGGQVWLESEVGQGTLCSVYLPRVEERGEQVKREPPQIQSRRGSETVLLVEDEHMVRALASRILQDHGYTVLSASDPSEALTLMAKHGGSVALLLTDVVLPQMSGRDLAQRVRETQPGARVLYMSGYMQQTIYTRGMLESEVAFLQKPFGVESLLRKVREVLDEPCDERLELNQSEATETEEKRDG